jgi:dipeptidyl aminopeptidase/acylaminoacyl peptidase
MGQFPPMKACRFPALLGLVLLWKVGAVFTLLAAEPEPAKSGAEGPKAELITFTADGAELHGWVCKPDGPGPFPAVIYNHGSEKKPGSFPLLAKFWTQHGFVFFVPHRRGHGRSPGEYIVDDQQDFRKKEKDPVACNQHDVETHEKANRDVVAAVAWLKEQPYVKKNDLVMSGISYGGIQTVLTAEKGLGIKAFVPFAPAAMSWKGNPLLRERLLTAVKKAKAPMFLLQAKNDYNLGPSEVLGAELEKKGAPNRSEIFAAFGDPKNPQDGHGGFAVRGSAVWGDEVLLFVKGRLGEQ